MRILIAEDDQVLADGLLRALRSAGAVVDQPAKSMLIAFGSGAALATLLILATRGRNN